MERQRIVLPPRVTTFRIVCVACPARQPESRGYMGSIVEGAPEPTTTTTGALSAGPGMRSKWSARRRERPCVKKRADGRRAPLRRADRAGAARPRP